MKAGPSERFTFDHAGFVARFGANRGERRVILMIALVPVVSTALLVIELGRGSLPLDGGMICVMITGMLWLVALGLLDKVLVQNALRLTSGRLILTSTLGPFTREEILPLVGLRAQLRIEPTANGAPFFTLTAPDRTWSMSGEGWDPVVLQTVADLVNRLAAATPPAESHVPPAAIRALLARMDAR